MKFQLDRSPIARALLIGCLALSATACLHDDDDKVVIDQVATNTAPNVTSTTVLSVEEGAVYSYTVTASDPEGDTLAITASTLPAWLTFNTASGVLTGTPVTTDVGEHPVTVNVSDGKLSTDQVFTITVTASPVVNAPPTITSSAVITGTVDVAYSYSLTANDADGDTLDMASVTLPSWGAFDTLTGIVSGTPDLADSYDVELMVSDGTDSVSQTFTIVVSAVPSSDPTVELVIFENMALAKWALWDCCASSTPSVETDDVVHDQVVEFDVFATPDTVQGFTAREVDGAVGGVPFDASAYASTGTLSFEMKVVTAPAAGTPWILKIESASAATNTGDYALNASNEGKNPVTGEWQTYTFNLSDLANAGLDLSAIDVFMIFPAWGQGAGAVYRVDNLYLYSDGAAAGSGPGSNKSGGNRVVNIADGIDFEGAEADQAAWETFENGDPSPALEFVTNPSMIGNTSSGVAKLTPLAAESCCGQFAGALTHSVQAFTLDASNAVVKIWVYKDKISPVGIKFERFNGDGYGSQGEFRASNTKINEWEQLTIDFTAHIGLPETINITGIVVFLDMEDGRPTDTVVYFDEITFTSN